VERKRERERENSKMAERGNIRLDQIWERNKDRSFTQGNLSVSPVLCTQLVRACYDSTGQYLSED